jgi:long-chain fatty acid transport protein
MNYRMGLLAALLAPVISLGSGALSSVHAAGFAIFTQGASALGQGNAVTAHSQSPSSIFYNPALINRLDGTQVEIGTTMIKSSREFESSTPGESSDSKSNTFYPSTVYITHKFNDSLSAGLGVFSPFGLGTEWHDDWAGRYIATKSELTTFNVNPVLSYQVIPSLSIAAGVDIIFLDASLEKKVPSAALAAFGLPAGVDINQKFKGDGTGVGFNVALALDLGKDVTLGASYRSEVKVKVKGDATFSSDVLPVGAFNSSGKTDITLPQQVTAAVSYKGIDALTLEAGLRWEGWSSFDKLTIGLDNGSSSDTPRNWKDSWGFNLGGKYRLNDTVALLAGYVYGNSSVPDSTFDPSIPDAATHVFCVGTDMNYQQFKIALAYAYQLYEDRTKNNDVSGGLPSPPFSAANGKYQSDAHLVAVSLGYKF